MATGGSLSDLIASIQGHLSHYLPIAEKIIIFDNYQDVSVKAHERKRWAGDIMDYELCIVSRDSVLHLLQEQ